MVPTLCTDQRFGLWALKKSALGDLSDLAVKKIRQLIAKYLHAGAAVGHAVDVAKGWNVCGIFII